jgi:hypothetical protein
MLFVPKLLTPVMLVPHVAVDLLQCADENLPFAVTLSEPEQRVLTVAFAVRTAIRRIWHTGDRRTKELSILAVIDAAAIHKLFSWSNLANQVFSSEDPMPPLPPASPFERVLQYMRSQAHHLAYCANPDCHTPYFFSQRSSQRYCSEPCALPFRLASKRRWWAKNREAQTRKRTRR